MVISLKHGFLFIRKMSMNIGQSKQGRCKSKSTAMLSWTAAGSLTIGAQEKDSGHLHNHIDSLVPVVLW